MRARELKFWDNVHPPPHVRSQVSDVRCQVSGVRFQVSGVICQVSGVRCRVSGVIFLFFLGQSGGASRWRVCYQRGQPRLVCMRLFHIFCSIYICFMSGSVRLHTPASKLMTLMLHFFKTVTFFTLPIQLLTDQMSLIN